MYLVKLLMVGDCGVGKTSLLLRFNDGSFQTNQRSTIGVDYKAKDIFVDGKTIRLQIWDTAGQERFRSMTSTFYSRAQGIIIVFDVTAGESFSNLTNWLKDVENEAPENCKISLCANKVDAPLSDWKVDRAIFEHFARDHNLSLYESSAATADNVEHV